MKRKTYYYVTTYNPDHNKTFTRIKKARQFVKESNCDEYWMIKRLTVLKSKFLDTYITCDGKVRTSAVQRVPIPELIKRIDEKLSKFEEINNANI